MKRNQFFLWGWLYLLTLVLTGCFGVGDKDQLTVEFRDFDDSLIVSQTVASFDEAIAPNPNRLGYTFLSWEESATTATSKVFRATYVPKTFKIRFENTGGEPLADIEVTFDQEVTLPLAMKTGFDFSAWTYENEALAPSFVYRYDHDIELVAAYADSEFHIIFYPQNGTTIPNLPVYYQQEIIDLPVPEKAGYQFVGWQENGVFVELPFTFVYQHDLELVAAYIKDKISVEFQDYDGTVLKTQLVGNLGDATCEEPQRFGFVFTGWDRQYTAEKVIFTALFEIGVYKITFASNSVQSIQSSSITFGQTVTSLPTPTKDNYMFVGWFLDGEKLETPFEFNLDHNVTLFARWEKTNFPAVSFQEVYDFGKKVDSTILNAEQYCYSNSTSYNFRAYRPSYGSVSSSTNVRQEARIDKTLNYYENHIFENNTEKGYEIFRLDGDNMYFDSLAYNNGKYILSTALYSSLANFFYEDVSISELFDADGSYRKVDTDHYLIYTNLGRLTNDSLDIDTLAKSINLPSETVAEISVEIEAIFSEQTKQMAISVEIKDFTFEINDIRFTLSIHLSTFVEKWNEAVIPFDTHQANVFLKIPSRIEDITDTTDISKTIISYETPNPHYYRVQFEPGLYEVTFSDFRSSNLDIFQEDLTEIKYQPLWQNQDFANNNCFIISTSGIYYIKIENSSIDDYTLAFTKVSYETLADPNQPVSLAETNEVICEGKFDFAYYYFDATADGVLILDAFGVYPLCCSQGFYQSYARIRDERGGKYYIPLVTGKNSVILGSMIAQNYSFTTQVIYDNPDTTEDLATMPVLSTSFSDETYLVGRGCENDYFRLDVAVAGVYTVIIETQDLAKEPYTDFYTEDNNFLYTSGTSISLQPGVYYIKVFYVSDIIIYRIKYDFVVDQGQTIDFAIATYSGSNPHEDPNVPALSGVLPTPNSRIFHKFTLTAVSTVFFNNYHEPIELYDEQMKKISFDYNRDPDYYRLNPGTYFLKIVYTGDQMNYQYSFAACLLANSPADDYPSDQFGTLSLGEIAFIYLDFEGDIDFYHFVAPETKTYYFRFSMNFALYRENGELIVMEEGYYFNKDWQTELESGTYYFIFFHNHNNTKLFGTMTVKDIPFS